MILVQDPIQASIYHALNHYGYTDAIFLAERLHAEIGNHESLFLLATSYYRSGKTVQAYTLLQSRGCPTPQCKYLMARCCLDLDKLTEAETILGGHQAKTKSVEDYINEFGDSACFTLALLARIYSQTEREAKASEFYHRSLKLNPFLWSSFESLCNLGNKPDPAQVFQVSAVENLNFLKSPPSYATPTSTLKTINVNLDVDSPQIISQDNSPLATSIPAHLGHSLNTDTPENQMIDTLDGSAIPPSAPLRTTRPRLRPGRNLLGAPLSLSPLTPSFGILPLDTPSPGNSQNTPPLPTYITPSPNLVGYADTNQPPAPAKKIATRRGQGMNKAPKPPVFSQSISNMKDVSTPSPPTGLENAGVRRSSRLFSNNSNSVKENNKTQSRGRFLVPARKSKGRYSKTSHEINDLNKPEKTSEKPSTITAAQAQVVDLQKQSTVGLMQLLVELGKAYVCLCQYECQHAVDLLSTLPVHHYYTGWVLSAVGRAHFEMTDYKQAEKMFSELRRVASHHFEGLEVYSTVLWHLQKEVKLSALAQELTTLDTSSPEAWCCAGNCFSLQKEHDTAIKFFQRAMQVDTKFAYAYTLLGHEYVLTEELDKAMACFRTAIRVDPRHYNAWYGVGMIYYKQEKFTLAEFNFRKALSVNPKSSVLLCHVAVVQHALHKPETALATLTRAISSDPRNPLCKFHKASILFATDRHKEALAELEELREIVPKESLVYFLMGKVQKKLGNTHLALMNFSWAVDLDPKGANNQIKEAIDKRYVKDDDMMSEPGSDASDEADPVVLMDADDLMNIFGNERHSELQANESDESL